MPVYLVQGPLGSGKTLICVKRITDALNRGCKIATNIDLFLENLVNPWAKKTFVLRMPDKPSLEDFEALPMGYEGKKINERLNGVLVLDECLLWLNSRQWNDKNRGGINDWMVLARKRRWDIYFLIQDVESMDKQTRENFGEHVVTCRRTDRFNIPFVGWILNLISKSLADSKFALPKVHVGVVQYGKTSLAPVVDHWTVWTNSLYKGYNTEQIFMNPDNPDACRIHSVLPPWYVYGRYNSRWEHFKNGFRNIALAGRHFFLAGAALAVVATNAAVTAMPETPKKGFFSCNQAYRELYGSCDAYPVVKGQQVVKGDKSKAAVVAVDAIPAGLMPVYVVGSVASSQGADYLFTCAGRSCDLSALGYEVEPVDWCSAIVTKGSYRTKLDCNPFYDESKPVKQSVAASSVDSAIDSVTGLFGSDNADKAGS